MVSIKQQAVETFGESGFPAAICNAGLKENRGWKAASTIKPTPKSL
jgi:hypothetical protein